MARITRIQERVVDLSKSLQSTAGNAAASEGETDSVNTGDEFDNPFDLSDGLRWWLIDAQEDKPGAPSTPGLGKSTVAANNVAAVADMHSTPARALVSKSKSKLLGGLGGGNGSSTTGGIEGVSRTLHRSLESRRSSTSSRKATPSGAAAKGSALASETNSLRAATGESPVVESPNPLTPSAAGPSGEGQQGGASLKGNAYAANPKSSSSPTDKTSGQQLLQQQKLENNEVRNHSHHDSVVDSLLGPS